MGLLGDGVMLEDFLALLRLCGLQLRLKSLDMELEQKSEHGMTGYVKKSRS